MRADTINFGVIFVASLLGSLIGDSIAARVMGGLLVTPFGWIVGKAIELSMEAKDVPVVVGEDKEENRRSEHWGILTDPNYFFVPRNIYHPGSESRRHSKKHTLHFFSRGKKPCHVIIPGNGNVMIKPEFD